MRILTCNIRYAGANDGPNGWEQRADACIGVIRSRQPDIICFQEMWQSQQADLQAALPEFATYGIAATADSRHAPNTIFYRRNEFTPICASGYWLSETPHVPGSKSWDSAYGRFANWLRLETIASGQEFRVINTHLDHIGQVARQQQAGLINQDAAAYPVELPQILAGDMNADRDHPAIQVLKAAGWRDACELILGEQCHQSTFNGFGDQSPQTLLGRIDWILIRGALQPTHAEIVREMPNDRYPSDHWFVMADLCLGR
jgi:endonuclease/exonuclease/phosphatase family metal-dependent hydrolase